jgi:signal transduction histidine kinase
LITNAIKYTPPDGHILIELEPRDGCVVVAVNDDGPGIPASQHAHIFEKFGQTKGGSEHRHSSGIGLAFCRMAIEAHGGTIGVSSEVGRGSTFWFKLPARVSSSPLANARAS